MQDTLQDSRSSQPLADVQTAAQEPLPKTLGQQEDDAIPEHVVIIMDGNHRWASARHLLALPDTEPVQSGFGPLPRPVLSWA